MLLKQLGIRGTRREVHMWVNRTATPHKRMPVYGNRIGGNTAEPKNDRDLLSTNVLLLARSAKCGVFGLPAKCFFTSECQSSRFSKLSLLVISYT